MSKHDPMELEPGTGIEPTVDRRPRMDEPLPVNLVAVEDVRLPAPVGIVPELDRFYIELFGFERVPSEDGLIYRAENLRIHFDPVPTPVQHDLLRPLGIVVPSIAEAEQKLIAAELDYERQRGLTPGHPTLLLRDPAGNWVELIEMQGVR